MKARDVLLALVGFIAGVIAGFVIYRKRKEILQRLESLSESIQETDIYEKAKYYVADIKQSLLSLLESSKDLPKEKEDEILNMVEEKIRKLEDIIYSER